MTYNQNQFDTKQQAFSYRANVIILHYLIHIVLALLRIHHVIGLKYHSKSTTNETIERIVKAHSKHMGA